MFFKKLFKKKEHFSSDEGGIIVQENSMSHKAEAYNRLRDNLLFINSDGNHKVIQIESSVAHEGKTTVAANLAVSLGLTEKKVIVVDLDFRRPRLQNKFNISIDTGMAEFMLGTADKKDIIKQTEYKNVSVITRGAKIHNSSLVLISEKFKQLIKELREEYDFVILDCAPILQISDYINILQVSDGVLLLVAYAQTTRGQVAEAVKEIRKNKGEILGTVFTMYDKKKDKGGYYGKNYGGYYYYNHTEEYAEDDEEVTKTEEK